MSTEDNKEEQTGREALVHVERMVISHQLAIKLEELTQKSFVPNKAYFCWCMHGDTWLLEVTSMECLESQMACDAYTVGELGDMLPAEIFENTELRIYKDLGEWTICYTNYRTGENRYREVADTEADARAKMIIKLLEEGVLQGI